MGRYEEGGGRAEAPQHLERRGGIEATENGQGSPREQRPGREAHRDRVVHRRAHHVEVVAIELPDGGFVLEHGLRRRLVPDPGGDPLGPAGGARGVVHGSGQRIGREFRLGTIHQRGQFGRAENLHRWSGVGHETIPLRRGEGGIEEDRDDADAGGPENGADQVGRGGQAERHPVTRRAPVSQERTRRAALPFLGLERTEQLDRGCLPAHAGSVLSDEGGPQWNDGGHGK